MFSAVTRAELPRALGVQREADRRLVVLVERRPRVAQIAAGHGGDLADQVVGRRGDAGAAGGSVPDRISMSGGTALFACSSSSRLGIGPCSDQLQLQQPGRADDLLRALDVGHARQLHEDLIAVAALDAR